MTDNTGLLAAVALHADSDSTPYAAQPQSGNPDVVGLSVPGSVGCSISPLSMDARQCTPAIVGLSVPGSDNCSISYASLRLSAGQRLPSPVVAAGNVGLSVPGSDNCSSRPASLRLSVGQCTPSPAAAASDLRLMAPASDSCSISPASVGAGQLTPSPAADFMVSCTKSHLDTLGQQIVYKYLSALHIWFSWLTTASDNLAWRQLIAPVCA